MITDATDATLNPNSKGNIEVITIDHLINVDPIAAANAAAGSRTAQQHIIPSAVKNRFINYSIVNNPDPSAQPISQVFQVPNGNSFYVIWSTEPDPSPGNLNNQLFGMPLTSIFVTNNPSTHLSDFVDGNHYPNSFYNASNFAYSSWIDENDQNNINIRTFQQVYNNSGATAYVAFVIRMRLLLGAANSASTFLLFPSPDGSSGGSVI